MVEQSLLLIFLAVFAFGLFARWFDRGVITPPMLFLALGWGFASFSSASMLDLRGLLQLVAEITLVVVLFTDGTEMDLRSLVAVRDWPARLLVVGMPVSILLGTLAGIVLLPGWPVLEVALLATLLVPTDAALSRPVIADERVPRRVRDTLAAESGLNDGIVLPIALFVGCLSVGGVHNFGQENWLVFATEQIAFGLAVGLVAGLAGGLGLAQAEARGFCDARSRGLAALALAGAAFLAAGQVGGNGLIAAFVAGIGYGSRPRAKSAEGRTDDLDTFLQGEGQLFSVAAFFLIGAVLLPDGLARLGWGGAALILVSLLAVRPLAAWIAMRGSGTGWRLKLFLGWFGPRGLATALFAVLIVDMLALQRGPDILALTSVAVMTSAVLHGLTAAPAARLAGGLLLPDRAEAPPPA